MRSIYMIITKMIVHGLQPALIILSNLSKQDMFFLYFVSVLFVLFKEIKGDVYLFSWKLRGITYPQALFQRHFLLKAGYRRLNCYFSLLKNIKGQIQEWTATYLKLLMKTANYQVKSEGILVKTKKLQPWILSTQHNFGWTTILAQNTNK